MGARRLRQVPPILAGLLGTFAATALAAGNSVGVVAPTNARVNTPYPLKLHGRAAGKKVLYIFVDDQHACAATPAKEHLRAYGYIWPVRGEFSEQASVTTHHGERARACAYLVRYSEPKNPSTGVVAHDYVAFTVH